MPRGRIPPPEPEPSKLRRSLGETEALLDRQIACGEQIASGLRQGALPPDARRWSDENVAILERFFTGPESTEYANCIVVGPMVAGGYDASDDEMSWHHARLEWLRSLRGRLYLYEPFTREAPAQVAVREAIPLVLPPHLPAVGRPVIFLSHISEEAPLAHVLKDWIESTFPDRARIFVSSDIRDIPAGSRWLEEIEEALAAAHVVLVLCSSLSLTRPWISVETGCALIKRVPVVPLCHSGQLRSQLPPPLSTFQALEVESSTFVSDLLTSIAGYLHVAQVPRIDHAAMREALNRGCGACRRPEGAEASPAMTADLDERDLRLLRVMAEHGDPGFSAEELGAACGLTKPRAQYHLDRLLGQKLVYRQLFMGGPAQWHLSAPGRSRLVELGML